MTVAVQRRELTAALDHVAHLAGRTRQGTAGSVHVRAAGGSLTLTVEGDVAGRLTVPADCGLYSHEIILPAELFAQLVRQMSADLLELDFQRDHVRIQGGGSSLVVNESAPLIEHPDAFTYAPSKAGAVLFAVDASDLAAAGEAVLYAASSEAYQAVMRGVLLSGDAAGVRLVATDGYRVAIADIPTPPPEPFTAVILGPHLRELLRIFKAGALGVQVTASHVTIRNDLASVTVPTMDGTFPDYRRVVPNTASSLTCDAGQLRDAVNRVAVLADRNANNRVTLTLDGTRVHLDAMGDYGAGRDTITGNVTGDAPTVTAINARMLLDALSVATGTATLAFKGPAQPFVLTSDTPGVQAVLVTLRA